MQLRITLVGKEHGSVVLADLEKNGTRKIAQGMRRGGAILEGQIKRDLSGPGRSMSAHGEQRTLKKGGAAGLYMARLQARGNPYPGTVTGALKRSVSSNVTADDLSVTLRVGPNVRYAAIHEFGGTIRQTVTKKQQMFLGLRKGIWKKVGSTLTIRIPERPYVSVAWDQAGDRVIETIRQAVLA